MPDTMKSKDKSSEQWFGIVNAINRKSYLNIIFNRATLCVSAAIAVVACLSVTHRYCIKTDKDIIKLFFSALYTHHYGFLTPHMVAKF